MYAASFWQGLLGSFLCVVHTWCPYYDNFVLWYESKPHTKSNTLNFRRKHFLATRQHITRDLTTDGQESNSSHNMVTMDRKCLLLVVPTSSNFRITEDLDTFKMIYLLHRIFAFFLLLSFDFEAIIVELKPSELRHLWIFLDNIFAETAPAPLTHRLMIWTALLLQFPGKIVKLVSRKMRRRLI